MLKVVGTLILFAGALFAKALFAGSLVGQVAAAERVDLELVLLADA